MVIDIKAFFIFSNICNNIKDMWGGRRHYGRQGQQGGEDQAREVAYICMYHFSWNYFNFEMICCGWHQSRCYIFNICKKHWGHVSLRSTTLWTASRNRKRSPWRSLTGLITSVGLLLMRAGMWSALLMLETFKCLTAQKCVTSDIIKVQDIINVEKEEKGASKEE